MFFDAITAHIRETDNEVIIALISLAISLIALGLAVVQVTQQYWQSASTGSRSVTRKVKRLTRYEEMKSNQLSRELLAIQTKGPTRQWPLEMVARQEKKSFYLSHAEALRKKRSAVDVVDGTSEALEASEADEPQMAEGRTKSQDAHAFLKEYQEVAAFVRQTIIDLPGLQTLTYNQSRRLLVGQVYISISTWLFRKSKANMAPVRVFPKPGEVQLSWMYGTQKRFTVVQEDALTGLGNVIPLGALPMSVLPRYEGARIVTEDAAAKPQENAAPISQTLWNMLVRTGQRRAQNTTADPNKQPPRPEPDEKEGDFFLGADMVQHEERRAKFAAVSLDDLKDDRDFYMVVRRKLQAARALSKAKGGTFEVPSDVKLAKFFFLPSKSDVVTTIPYDECTDNPFTPPRPYYHGTMNTVNGTPGPSSQTTAEIWDLIRGMDPDLDKGMRIYFQILGEYIRDGVRWPDAGAGLTNVLNMLPRRPSPPALERKPLVKEWCFHASYASTGKRQGSLWAVALGGMLVSVLFAVVWLWRVDAKDLQNASTVFLCYAAGFAMLQMIWAQRR